MEKIYKLKDEHRCGAVVETEQCKDQLIKNKIYGRV